MTETEARACLEAYARKTEIGVRKYKAVRTIKSAWGDWYFECVAYLAGRAYAGTCEVCVAESGDVILVPQYEKKEPLMHDLSKQEIKELKEIAEKATPYAEDDPIWGEYDGKYDHARASAFLAQKLLDEYYAEQKQKRESDK